MFRPWIVALMATTLLSTNVLAQETNSSSSTSGANSGSSSAANSNPTVTTTGSNVTVNPLNNGIGTSQSDSNSTANAQTSSSSGSYASTGGAGGAGGLGGSAGSTSSAQGGNAQGGTGEANATTGPSTASNAGNSQTINNNSYAPENSTQKIKSAPPIAAPALTTTLTETCMGSSTGGLSVVGWGITGGTTWRDSECVRRLNARELAQTLGDREAAKEVLCGNEDVFRAYNAIGRPCRMLANGTTNPYFSGQESLPYVPAPPPLAAIPSSAVASSADTKEFTVYFPFDRSDLTPEAREAIRKAAENSKAGKPTKLSVVGMANLTGTPSYNIALSERRARSVESALASQGVKPGDMTLAWKSNSTSANSAAITREPLDRRTEISSVTK